MNITLKGLITSFTKSIDLYNYLLKNHHRRTAIADFLVAGVDVNSQLAINGGAETKAIQHYKQVS